MDLLLVLAAEALDWLLVLLTLGYLGRRPHRHGVDWGDADFKDEAPPVS